MDLLRLFVYGTLKRGYWNHDLFCEGVLEIREAQIRGRLYEGPGFPVLEVPDEDILARAALPTHWPTSPHRRACPTGWDPSLRTRPRKCHSGRLGRRVRGAAHVR